MSQRIQTFKNSQVVTQIVSGTEIMTPGEGGAHTRLLWASVPPFASRPDITVTISAPETAFYAGMPECWDGEDSTINLCGNVGATFVPWAIEYHARSAAGGNDLIAICSANTDPGVESSALFVCSYVAIGEAIDE